MTPTRTELRCGLFDLLILEFAMSDRILRQLTQLAIVLLCVLVGTRASVSVLAAEDFVPTETFFPKPTCSVWKDGKEVTTEPITGPFTCTRREKDWLWIGSGWVFAGEVVSLENAVEYYTDLLRTRPNDEWIYNARAVVWIVKRDFTKAVEDLNESLRLRPNSTHALRNRAIAWMRANELDKALADFDELIRLQPSSGVAFSDRGVLRIQRGEPSEAAADFDAAIKLGDITSTAYGGRGLARAYMLALLFADDEASPPLVEAAQLALADCAEAIRLNPDETLAYRGQSAIYAAKGDNEGVIRAYNQIIRIHNREPAHYLARASLLYTMDRYGDAIRDFSSAVELGAKDASVYCMRGRAWQAVGNIDNAIDDLSVALELSPDDAEILVFRANAYELSGKTDLAIRDCTAAIQANPRCSMAFVMRGEFREKNGDVAEALADYTAAIEVDPANAKAWCVRALMFVQQNKFREAINDFERAIQVAPSHPLAYGALATVLISADNEPYRNLPRAVELSKKACELTSWEDADYLSTLAAAHAANNDRQAAIDVQTRVIAMLKKPDDLAKARSRLEQYRNQSPAKRGDK